MVLLIIVPINLNIKSNDFKGFSELPACHLQRPLQDSLTLNLFKNLSLVGIQRSISMKLNKDIPLFSFHQIEILFS